MSNLAFKSKYVGIPDNFMNIMYTKYLEGNKGNNKKLQENLALYYIYK